MGAPIPRQARDPLVIAVITALLGGGVLTAFNAGETDSGRDLREEMYESAKDLEHRVRVIEAHISGHEHSKRIVE